MFIVTSSSTPDQRETVGVYFDLPDGIRIDAERSTPERDHGLSVYLSIDDAREVVAALQAAIIAAQAVALIGAAQ